MQRFTETTHHSVAWLKKISDEGVLEMKPPFQRNPVWSEKQKGSLIETILLEYPVPEIYMQDIVDESGVEKHIVVDGQQRIRSILEYIAGEYEIAEEDSPWVGMSFDELSSADKKKIYEYKLVTRVLPSIADDQIRSIFQRINRNTVTLNNQELRHATYWGQFIKLMEEISDYDYWSKINIFSANDRRRMLDTEFVSELTVAYLNGLQNKKIKLEDYFQLYEREFEQTDEVRTVFQKVLGELDQAFPELGKTRWRKKSDFYSLFLVLSKYQSMFPLSSDYRKKLQTTLQAFGEEVDRTLRGTSDAYDESIHDYAFAVDRAASDLGSRRARDRVLDGAIEAALKPVLSSGPAEMEEAVAAQSQETPDLGD